LSKPTSARLGCPAGRRILSGARTPGAMWRIIDMIEKQLTYDALKIIAFDGALAQGLVGEMRFMYSLAKAGSTTA
jgi:hypothetical protein